MKCVGDQVWVKRGPVWDDNTEELSRMINRNNAKALTPGVVLALDFKPGRTAAFVALPDCCGWTNVTNIWGGEK